MHNPTSSCRHNSGFTLLELLTATAIATALVVMLVSVFNEANKAWTAGEEQVEVYQMGRGVMDLMIRDFSQVRVTPRCAFTGMPGDISFCASVGSMTNRSDLEYIRYRYSNSGLPTCSLARASANFATPASPSSETLLTSNVLIFTVRYWTNNNSHSLTPWPNGMDTYNSIPTTNGPVALEVILGLLPTRRTDAYWRNEFARINISNAYMRVFREMIYLPNSRP